MVALAIWAKKVFLKEIFNMRLLKKKNISYILVAAMAMTVLTGCSKDDDKKVEDTNVESTVTEEGTEKIEDATDATEDATEEAEDVTEDATEEAEDMMEDGLTYYTATEQGFGGEVSVTVALNEDGSIANIDVKVDSETPELGGVAGPEVAKAIVENQSLDVDSVSGASVTSAAVKNAVKAALTEAGSDLAQ